MSVTGLEVFDTTVHKTNSWLRELMDELGWSDGHKAYLALRATLHALRDRLTVQDVAQLGAQLPMLIRGFYYEGWVPSDTPLKVRHKDQFLALIEQQFSDGEIETDLVARRVFAVLSRRIADGEMRTCGRSCPPRYGSFCPEGSNRSVDYFGVAWSACSSPARSALMFRKCASASWRVFNDLEHNLHPSVWPCGDASLHECGPRYTLM